ncbi:MAG: hypothetical protein ACIAXF_17365 [Phycisphaerales bacterium JB063]
MDDEKLDAFEQRLRSVAPVKPTDELRERVAMRLETRAASVSGPRHWWPGPIALGVVGLASAACVGVVVWLAVSGPAGGPSTDGDGEASRDTPAAIAAQGGDHPDASHRGDKPTAPAGSLLAYHRALRAADDVELGSLVSYPVTTHSDPARHDRPLRAMDTAMFLNDKDMHDKERFDR